MKKKLLTITTLVLSLLTSHTNIIFASNEVQTGDGTSFLPYILLLVVAAGAIGVLYWYNKKRK